MTVTPNTPRVHYGSDADVFLLCDDGLLLAEDEPTIRRAEALRRSMLELMTAEDRPHFAQPMFWAPFVIAGEGGTQSVN